MNTNDANASQELAKRLSETVNAAWEISKVMERHLAQSDLKSDCNEYQDL